MLIRQGPTQSTSSVEAAAEGGGENRSVGPARLPKHSRAAAAQRLNDVPTRPARGAYYAVPHSRLYPAGWRTKRHLKRKMLRYNTRRFTAVDRMSTQWAMLPMALGALIFVLVLSGALVGVTAAVTATQQRFGDKTTTLEDILPKDSMKIYDKQGTLIYHTIDQGIQTSVPLSKISKHLINAEVAIEDQHFWSNPGYDITGIVRAALDNLALGRVVSGGSTITQQLIKNAIVGNQATVTRKLQEIILAPDVTRRYTKEQIMTMYLNTVYYGQQSYGVEAAAFTYFGLKPTEKQTAAQQLTIAQAAMLAGIPSSPIARDPYLHPKAANGRMQEVLKQMYLLGYITHQERMKAIFEAQKPDFLKRGTIRNDKVAIHFVRYAMRELANELHVKVSDLSRAGLMVSTTLNLPMQKQVLKIAQKHIAANSSIHNMSNAAVVVLDHRNGAIQTLLGNIDPNDPTNGEFDVASQGFRQAGSSFKPFIYATAFNKGISPGTPVLDAPLTVHMCCGLPSWSPLNYDLKWHGLITYRFALQNSFNIPAVKLLMQTGVDEALETAQKMGIGEYVGTPNYTMVLGTLGVHLTDMVGAYSVFANDGVLIPKHAIDTVTDITGEVIYRYEPKGKRILSKQVAFMMTDVMSDNVSRTYEFGKCNMLYLFSNSQTQCYAGSPGPVRPSAAKTGTSNEFRDNWTMGYTSNFVVGVWAGNNSNAPMVNVTGVDGAGPIWHDTMLLAEKGNPIEAFAGPPSGVIKKKVTYPGITTTDWYVKP